MTEPTHWLTPLQTRVYHALQRAAGEWVSGEALAAVLWPEAKLRPAGDPYNTVKVHVSHVRTTLKDLGWAWQVEGDGRRNYRLVRAEESRLPPAKTGLR